MSQTCHMQSFIILASLCSLAGWFENDPIGHPEDSLFSHDCRRTLVVSHRQANTLVDTKMINKSGIGAIEKVRALLC